MQVRQREIEICLFLCFTNAPSSISLPVGFKQLEKLFFSLKVLKINNENSLLKILNENESKLTSYLVHVIGPRTSLAVPTSIGPSVLPVGHVSSWTSSTPPLILYSEDWVPEPQSNQRTFQDGVCSSSVKTRHQCVATIHLWDGSASSVFVASKGFDCTNKQQKYYSTFNLSS